MIDEVIKQIEVQQKGNENTAPYYVGEQLKDIIRNNPQAAEIALALLAADVGVVARLHHGLFGHFKVAGLSAPIPLGKL